MGMLDNLFGGGGSKSETKIKKKEKYTPEQRKILGSLSSLIQGGLNEPAPVSPETAVGTTQGEQEYMDFVREMAKIRSSPAAAEEYFEEALRPIYEEEYQRYTVPGIREAYAGPTYYGSSRQRQETRAAEDLATKIASERAKLAYSTVEQAPETAEMLTGVGELERSVQQEEKLEDLNKFLMGEEVGGAYNPAYNPNVAMAFNLLGIEPYEFFAQTKETSEAPGLFSSLLSGAGQGMGSALGGKIAKLLGIM